MGLISPTSLTSAYLEIKYLMRRQSSMERGKSYMFVLFRLLGCYTVFILGTIWSNVWIVFGKISALVTSYFLCLLTGRESREERRGDGMKEGEGFSWSPLSAHSSSYSAHPSSLFFSPSSRSPLFQIVTKCKTQRETEKKRDWPFGNKMKLLLVITGLRCRGLYLSHSWHSSHN